MDTKRCTKCSEVKPLTEFRCNKNNPDGREYQCRECRKAIGLISDKKESRLLKKKNWINENRDIYNGYIKKWQKSNPELYKECLNNYENRNREKRWFAGIKYRIERTGVEFNLTLEDIHIPEYCPILNIPLIFSVYNGNDKKHVFFDNSPSIDRIDNNLGYVKGNVWIISRLANLMKNKGSFENLYNFSNFFHKNIKEVDGKYVFTYNNDSHTNS